MLTRREFLKFCGIGLAAIGLPWVKPRPALASVIAFDSVLDGGDNGGTTNSLTYAFNNVAGNILFVVVVGDTGGGSDDITGVTYNSVALSFVGKSINASQNRYSYVYMLAGPATGSNNVVVSCTNTHFLLSGAVSYSGASLTGQPDNSTTNDSGVAASTLTTSLSSVADNCWHMVMFEGASSTPTAGAGTTRRAFEGTFATWGIFDSNSAKTPAGSVSLITDTASPDALIAHVMASFKPVAAVSGRIRHRSSQ